MVLENDYPEDLRITKEASALRAGGHEVHLLCLEFGSRPLREDVDGIHVHRVRLSRGAYNRLHPTVVRWPIYRLRWRWWVSAFVDRIRPQVLHVHDLPVAAPVLEVGASPEVPVVLDLHENFPAAIEGWGFDRGRVGGYFYDLSRWRAYEADAVARADAVVVVVEEARTRFAESGVDPDRMAVIGNSEPRTFGADETPSSLEDDGPLRLLYIGGFGPHRGLDVAIRGMAELPPEVDVHLRIVGGGKIRGQLEALVAELELGSRVTIAGPVPLAEVAGEIARAQVGLVPHRRSEHTETTIPHKLFQYMMLGRPVIVSDCAPLARVVRAHDAGEVFVADDPQAFAAAVGRLTDASRRREAGGRGREAATTVLGWERDAEKLRDLYERLLRRPPRRRRRASGSPSSPSSTSSKSI
jgi:glycosyltransferase involved in cell wall biosynthesis